MTPAQILEDFRRRYEGTFVFVQEPESDKENLFQIYSVAPDTERLGRLDLVSEELGRIYLNFGSAHTLKFKPVPVGVFQFGNEAYYCRRHPARQYRRGICRDNTTIKPVVNMVYEEYGNTINHSSVKAAFEGKKYTYKEAFTMCGTGKYRSVAIHGDFALSLSLAQSNDYILFYFDWPIARISPEGKLTLIMEEAYRGHITKLMEEKTDAICA